MGAWGVGLQASDSALDAIDQYREEVKDENALGGIILAPKKNINVTKAINSQFKSDKKYGGFEGTLGLAEWLLELGHDLSSCKDILTEAAEYELKPENLDEWRTPNKRKKILQIFLRRINDEKFDIEEVKESNKGLFDRILNGNPDEDD